MQAGSHGWKTEVTKKVEKVWSDACAPRNWFWCSFPSPLLHSPAAELQLQLELSARAGNGKYSPCSPKHSENTGRSHYFSAYFLSIPAYHGKPALWAPPRRAAAAGREEWGKKNGKLVTCFTSCLSMVCCMLKIEEQLTCELSKHECNI